MNSGYKILSAVYDRWQRSYGKDFSSLILPKLLRTLKTYKISSSAMLDLACGTGTLAVIMARRGWEVFGVDSSQGMINECLGKTKGTHFPITFLRQDMRSFSLQRRVTLATCMFDAINHLMSPRDVLRCFRSVYNALETGGYFIFDVNNELCYKTVWRQTDAIHEPGFSIILQNSFDARSRRAESKVTLFEREGNLFERKEETVCERYYRPYEIKSLLHRAGFEVLECDDFNFTPDPMVGEVKTWWVAQRRS